MRRNRPRYDDGLDDDGYPLAREPWRQQFVHGSEADAGDFQPSNLRKALITFLDRTAVSLSISSDTESPIEVQLGAAICLLFENKCKPLKIATNETCPNAGGLALVPQFRWSIYRSDWAIYNPKTAGALLIEADGKDFHSSEEQKAHDAKKDAAARDRGFISIRFSGSQIHRDADGCAADIFSVVYGGRK
jgi:very-short-patch-repair endonuclease